MRTNGSGGLRGQHILIVVIALFVCMLYYMLRSNRLVYLRQQISEDGDGD